MLVWFLMYGCLRAVGAEGPPLIGDRLFWGAFGDLGSLAAFICLAIGVGPRAIAATGRQARHSSVSTTRGRDGGTDRQLPGEHA